MTTFEDSKASCESLDAAIDRQFGDPGFTLSDHARRHLAGCVRCRQLYAFLFSPSTQPPVPPQLSSRVAKALTSNLKPVRPLGSTKMLALLFFILFALLAVSISSAMNPAGLRAMTALQLAAISLALLAGAILLSLSLAWQMVPGSLQRIPAAAAVTALAIAFFVTIAFFFPWRAPEEFISSGLHCLKLGMALAVPGAILFVIVIRRGAPLKLGRVGAASGALAGLSSLAILQSNCPMQEAIHLLVWHGAVLGISILTGFLIGQSIGSRAYSPPA